MFSWIGFFLFSLVDNRFHPLRRGLKEAAPGQSRGPSSDRFFQRSAEAEKSVTFGET